MKVGTVTFLNAYPLFSGLEEKHEIIREVPSAIAGRLANGEIDAALVSAVEYFRNPGIYRFHPSLCVSSRGAVDSIRLFGDHELLRPRKKIYIDYATRTSVVLAVYLNELLFPGTNPDLLPLYPPYEEKIQHLKKEEAALVIGDSAMQLSGLYPSVDLGALYTRLTGRHFVYALWLARREIDHESLFRDMTETYHLNMRNPDLLAERAEKEYPFSRERILRYITGNIHYDLSEATITDMEWFFNESAGIYKRLQ